MINSVKELIQALEESSKKPEKLLALHFSPGRLAIVYAQPTPSSLCLLACAIKELPEESGLRQEAAIAAIKAFVKEHGIKEKEVILSIPESSEIVIKHFSIAVLPKNEIESASMWKLKEEATFDIDKAVVAWQVVRDYTDEENIKQNDIVCVAASREVIDRHLSIVYQCGLKPYRIATNAFNYGNVVRRFSGGLPLVAVLDLSANESVLSIYLNANLGFIRTLPISIHQLKETLREEMASGAAKVHLSEEDLRSFDHQIGVPLQDNIEDVDPRLTQLMFLMRPILEAFVREINFSFHYFTSYFGKDKPPVLCLTGQGGGFKNLDKYFAKELGIKVSLLAAPVLFDMHQIKKEGFEKDQNALTSPIGSVLDWEKSIDLLPHEIKRQKIELAQKIILRMSHFTAMVVLSCFLVFAKYQEFAQQEKLKIAKNHLMTLQGLQDLKQIVKLQESFIAEMQKDQLPADGILKMISIVVPDRIILGRITVDMKKHSMSLNGAVRRTGNDAEAVLSEFLQKMEETSFIEEATLRSSQKEEDLLVFDVVCDLAGE